MKDVFYAVDTESNYGKEFGIGELGAYHYLRDPRCDLYMASIYGPGIDYAGPFEEAPWEEINGKTWVIHNASYDGLVFHRAVEKAQMPAHVQPSEFHCTANLSCYLGGPRSLKDAAKVWLGVEASKEMRNWMKDKTWQDAVREGKAEALLQYARDDAKLCYQLWEKLAHLWPESERRIANITTTSGWRGVHIDLDLVNEGIGKLVKTKFEAESRIPWIAEGYAPVSTVKLAQMCRDNGIEPPASTSEKDSRCEKWENQYGEQFPWVAAMRDWRKSNRSLKVLESMKRRTRDTDGCCAAELKYFGAVQTGRWSGAGGLNWQNLPRDNKPIDIRGCIIPRPGKKIIAADFSQIEPRVTHWIAGDTNMLDFIRQSDDFYDAQARAMGIWKEPEPLRTNPAQRHLVKGLNLGLSYGMSAARFSDVANVPLDEAERLVNLYRSKNPKVLAVWRKLDLALKKSAAARENFEMTLPSGRTITYWNCRLSGREVSVQRERGGNYVRIWGSAAFENLVQAIAREIMADAILKIDADPRFDFLFSVHDEALTEADPDVDPSALEHLMSIPPEWAADLPLAAEAKSMDRYSK